MLKGQIKQNQIPLSAELIVTFLNLWSHLEVVRKPDVGLPFFHLMSDGFWHYKPKIGFESLIAAKVKIRTPNTIRETVEYAYLDNELFEILQNSNARSYLTHALTETWFTNRTQQIEQLLQINAFQELEKYLQATGGKVYQPEEIENEQDLIVRDATFRRMVVSAYDYHCALCGLRITTPLSENVVDAAHIKPFSLFYDDRINNGLSLCKNHHWAFDRFWFTINNDYTITVANDLLEESPNSTPIKDFQNQFILLPNHTQYYPRQDALQWHREAFFTRAA